MTDEQGKIDDVNVDHKLNDQNDTPINKEENFSSCPLYVAVIFMFGGAGCLFIIKDIYQLLFAYFATVTISQAAIDLYTGENKRFYSAALRIVILVLAGARFYFQ